MIAALSFVSILAMAQNNGGISPEMLKEIRSGYENNSFDKAVRNALNTTAMNVLASNAEAQAMIATDFTDRVKTVGITNQKQSGRCWLFTGLNVLRSAAIQKHDLGDFQFSQSYCFFYDQLEKSNLFLQAVIDTRNKPMDDREVNWLFSNPLSDGGTFTGVADLVTKYGVVPADAMPESFIANSTSQMSTQLKTLLRQDGLRLRSISNKAEAQKAKVEMLKEVYHVLGLCLGVPPTTITWKGQTMTPVEYYQSLLGFDLENNYVMLMNDPTREYGKVYEIEYDRHTYDGHNWLYVNLPIERIKEMAIASIKANTAMYFSCDVGKFLNRQKGTCDLRNFDYESLLGVKYTMDKKERIEAHASGSSHAMTLIAVNITDEGKTDRWMVENSWGADSGWKGNIIMTDEWFDNYMFRLVVEKQFVPADVMKMLQQKPIQLPAWDPMFSPEE